MNNIKLIPLEQSHIEMVRNWRNSPDVAKYMYTDNHITKEMQQAWFEKINNDKNYKYWIISDDKYPIGLMMLKLNDIKNEAELGCYIAECKGQGKGSVAFSQLLDIAFLNYKLEKLSCEALDFNLVAINLYKKFGFVEVEVKKDFITKNNKNYDVVCLCLTKEKFFNCKLNNENIEKLL